MNAHRNILGADDGFGNFEKPELIRTVYRLRSGLPPYEHLENLTVAEGRIFAVLQDLLKSNLELNCAILRGNYGGGKTHLLSLFSEMARREGYATCHISADGYVNALNHPQRFLPSLLATLDVPFRETYGYTDLLYDILSDLALTRRLRAIASFYLDGWSSVATQTRKCLHQIQELLEGGACGTDQWYQNVRLVTYDLTGDSIRHFSAAPNYRQTAYRLLLIARDMLLEVGAKGLAISVDEVESIYTKLPNVRSRRGALRVLAALSHFEKCRVLLAITPDAHNEITSDLDLSHSHDHLLLEEQLGNWAAAIRTGVIPVMDCKPLSGEGRKTLLRAVRMTYVDAYRELIGGNSFEEIWQNHIQIGSDLQIPVRLVVRQAIDIMDSFRYSRTS